MKLSMLKGSVFCRVRIRTFVFEFLPYNDLNAIKYVTLFEGNIDNMPEWLEGCYCYLSDPSCNDCLTIEVAESQVRFHKEGVALLDNGNTIHP